MGPGRCWTRPSGAYLGVLRVVLVLYAVDLLQQVAHPVHLQGCREDEEVAPRGSPGVPRGRGTLTTCFCLRGFTQKVPSACWGGENKGVSTGAEPSSLGTTPKQPRHLPKLLPAPTGCREGTGGPQPHSHLLEGGQQHMAVPGVLCKKTTSGGAQGTPSHGGTEDESPGRSRGLCVALSSRENKRGPSLTIAFIHHRVHHHGEHLPVQVEAQLQGPRRKGSVRRSEVWSPTR